MRVSGALPTWTNRLARASRGSATLQLAAASGWPVAEVVERGTTLFCAGAPVQEIFWIASGLVRLVRRDPSGREVTTGIRRSTCLLGGAAATSGDSHAMSAIAIAPSRVHRLSVADFHRRLGTASPFASRAREVIAEEWSALLEDWTRPLLPTLERRLSTLLPAIVDGGDDDDLDDVRVPSEIGSGELADLLQVTPDTLERRLDNWECAGYVRRTAAGLLVHRALASGQFADLLEGPAPHSPPPSPPLEVPPLRDHAPIDHRVHHALVLIHRQHANAALDLPTISRQMNMSLWHLSRLLTRATGLGFRQLLTAVRVEHARVALATTQLSVKEISALVGYNHSSDLTRRFRAAHGVSPIGYRLQLKARAPHPPDTADARAAQR